MRSLGLTQLTAVADVICGLGGVDVTPSTLRWALAQTGTLDLGASRAPVYVPDGVS